MIKFQKVIKDVGPKGTYSINEQDGILHVVQYKYSETGKRRTWRRRSPSVLRACAGSLLGGAVSK